jgi:hypothetical protein
MAVRSCQVTLKDMDGVTHTVEVTAETLYEAVALGLAAIRAHGNRSGLECRSGMRERCLSSVEGFYGVA